MVEQLVRQVSANPDDRHAEVTHDGDRRVDERALSDVRDLRPEDLRRRRVHERLTAAVARLAQERAQLAPSCDAVDVVAVAFNEIEDLGLSAFSVSSGV